MNRRARLATAICAARSPRKPRASWREHGIRDFLTAKRKAAERLGVADCRRAAENAEIEAALRAYQRLFDADGHDQSLKEQRRAALHAMRLLGEFRAAAGRAGADRHRDAARDIKLHLFADGSEAVAIRLMELGVPHSFYERRVKMDADRSVNRPALRFEAGARTIDATIFPIDGIRQSPYSPVDGRPMRRADMREVAELIDAG